MMAIEKILPLLIIFFLGYVLKRIGFFNQNDSDSYAKLFMYLIVPAIALKVFSTIDINFTLLLLPIAGLLIVTLLLISAWVMNLFIKDKSIKDTIYLLLPTFEVGGIGYPIMLSVLGEKGLERIVLFDMGHVILLFTVVYLIACHCRTKSGKTGDALKEAVKKPVIYAIMAGILLNILNFTPGIFMNLLEMIVASLVFVIMFMLGIDFSVNLSYLKAGIFVTVIKTVLGLGLGFLAVYIFGFTGVEKTAVLVACVLPSSILTVAYAKENRMNVKFMANVFSLAIPFSLVVIITLLSVL